MTEGPEPAPSDAGQDPARSGAVNADRLTSDPAHPDAEQPDPDPDTADAHSTGPDPVSDTAHSETEQPDPAPEDAVTTGHAEIDTALRRLDELDGRPVERHGEVYDELHGRLRDALTAAATPTSESSDA